MNKTETFKTIVEKLLEIENTSNKCVFMYYHGSAELLDIHITPNKINIYEKLLPNQLVYLNKTTPDELEKLLSEIEAIKQLPDGPVEEILNFKISESKARKLGLIT
jgi:hypothetical protein